MDKETYERSVTRMQRDRQVSVVCSSCGVDIPEVLEDHHIFGRNNSDETTPLCKNCHSIITQEQNKVSPKLRSPSASPQQKRGYILLTVGALLELIGKNLKNIGHEVLNHE